MQHNLSKQYYSRLWRAIIEFDLIAAGDRILIGLSGGKDSLFLTYALAMLRKSSPVPFDLGAFTVDPMFTDDFAVDKLADFCRALAIPFASKQVNIAGAISKGRKEPCFTCAFFRRGAVNRQAQQAGYNKIAYAHHNDDAVETLLLGLLYAGQLKTFAPKTFLSRTKLTVIRPLIFFREAELQTTIPLHGLTPLPNPCPFDGQTKRQEIKDLLKKLGESNPSLYANLAGAIRFDKSAVELWPPPLPREDLRQKHAAFWRLKNN